MSKAKDDNNTPSIPAASSEPVELASFLAHKFDVTTPVNVPTDIVRSFFDKYPMPFFDRAAPLSVREWSVRHTGSYTDDLATGAAYAEQFLRSADGTAGWSALLSRIAAAMISAGPVGKFPNGDPKVGGVVIGFFLAIGRTLNQQRGTPSSSPSPDNTLLALGRQFDLLAAEHEAARQKLAPLWAESTKRLEAWDRANPSPPSGAALAEVQRLSDELGITAIVRAGEHTDPIADRIDPIARQILDTPAHTLAGLAVKARLARFSASDYWDAPADDCDCDELYVRNLIDAVLSVAEQHR